MNFNIKLNLQNLKCVCRHEKSQSGLVECLIIPLEQNHLFKGEKGIYLDLSAFELKERKDDRTHLIKQHLPKEVFQSMNDEQKRAIPIIGSVTTWEAPSETPVSNSTPLEPESGLPF